MIVVAIIGILAAIAIPAYGKYQAKSKLTAALAEISAGKTAAEEHITNGQSDITSVADIGLQATTSNCAITATSTSGAASIACIAQSVPSQVAGATLTWTRNATSGAWSCATTGIPAANKDLAPKNCPQS